MLYTLDVLTASHALPSLINIAMSHVSQRSKDDLQTTMADLTINKRVSW
jgi:hypothetical protein